jgi:5-formyltetrahydrofolate cyclo-ligase
MTKADIRNQIAERKKSFQRLDAASAQIIKNLRTLEFFRSAQAVGVYMPLADEADLRPVFQYPEKRFYIPAFDEASGFYRMARLTPEVKKGRFGILEPSAPVFAAENELDLILVPGVAFDLKGRRIGRGGGFYDRLLPQYRALRAGICFDFQCLEAVPAEHHDIPMDWMVTEHRILKTSPNH